MKPTRADVLRRLAVHVVLLVVAGFVLLPFVWMVSSSVKDLGTIFAFPPKLIPAVPRWVNYLEIWEVVPFGTYFLNSSIVAVLTVSAQVLTSSLAAFAFARLAFPGRDKIFLLYLATLMIPVQVTLIPNFILMRILGLINSFGGLVLPMVFTAFGTFLLRQFFMTIPKELDEASIIDGAGWFCIYRCIVMPLSKPALATLTVFTFMKSWNDFLWPLIIVNSQRMSTLPLGLASFKSMFSVQWHLIMAAAVITIIPVLVLYIASQRYFIEGIALTGIKG